jgi:hypothetical protein
MPQATPELTSVGVYRGIRLPVDLARDIDQEIGRARVAGEKIDFSKAARQALTDWVSARAQARRRKRAA